MHISFDSCDRDDDQKTRETCKRLFTVRFYEPNKAIKKCKDTHSSQGLRPLTYSTEVGAHSVLAPAATEMLVGCAGSARLVSPAHVPRAAREAPAGAIVSERGRARGGGGARRAGLAARKRRAREPGPAAAERRGREESEPRRPWPPPLPPPPPPAAEGLGPRAPASADDGDRTGRAAAAAAASTSQDATTKARRGGAAAVSRTVPAPTAAAAVRGEREAGERAGELRSPPVRPQRRAAGREAAARGRLFK
nr:uncharacterized protein LOC127490777 [Oryctolagus cuniculus]